MFKKKFINFFVIFLLLLLLGLSSSSYALTLTENDIRNFCENAYKSKVNVDIPSSVEQYISNADFSTWANYTTEYEGQWIITYNDKTIYFMAFTGSAQNLDTYCMYKASTRIYVNTSYLTRITRQRFSLNNGQFVNNSDIYDDSNFMYCDGLVTNNGQRNGTIVYAARTYKPNSDIFSGRYTNDKFEFSPTASNFQVCSINGLVQPSEVYVYERTTQNYLTLGYLEKFSNLDNISITQYRYNRSNGWVEFSDWATDDFSGYNVQDDVLTYTIDVSRINADTLVLFNFTPNNIEDFTNQTFALYVKSPYTVISNGVIYPAQTFSGDYYNNYNDDSNTDKIVDNNKSDSDKIIDTLTDDSQVDNILGDFISGDAEDIAKKFGFSLFNRYYYDFIHDTIEDIVEVLEQEGDVYFDYSMHGESPTRIYSSQFTTPNGTLKTFLSMFLISCTVFAFYKYIADIIELISTGNVLEALREFNVDRNIFKM